MLFQFLLGESLYGLKVSGMSMSSLVGKVSDVVKVVSNVPILFRNMVNTGPASLLLPEIEIYMLLYSRH